MEDKLTLVVVVLVIGCSIEHSENLENVAVAVVAMELVPGAVEAQNQLSWFLARLWGWKYWVHRGRAWSSL